MNVPSLTVIPAFKAVQIERPTRMRVKVQIEVPALDVKPNRIPLNLSFVVDRSGSMGGEKLRYAKQALHDAFVQLKPEDRLSIVTFDDEIAVDLPSTRVDEVKDLKSLIQQIKAGGTTALFAGWERGAKEIESTLQDGALNRVLLLSDGQANVGPQSPSQIAPIVAQMAKQGVSTSALGIGVDFDEKLMQAISDAGEGTYFFVEHPKALPTFFEGELNGMNALYGTAGRLGFLPAPGCRLIELVSDLQEDPAVNVNTWLESEVTGVMNPDAVQEGLVKPTWWALPPFTAHRKITALLEVEVAPGTEPALLGDFFVSWIPSGMEARHATLGASPRLDRVTATVFSAMAEDENVDASYKRSRSRRIMKEMHKNLEDGDIVAFNINFEVVQKNLEEASAIHATPSSRIESSEVFLSRKRANSGDVNSAKKMIHDIAYKNRDKE